MGEPRRQMLLAVTEVVFKAIPWGLQGGEGFVLDPQRARPARISGSALEAVTSRSVTQEKCPWEQIEPEMSGQSTDGGVTGRSNRRLIEAMRWIGRTGSPIRDLPEDLGNWHPVFRRYPRGFPKGLGQKS